MPLVILTFWRSNVLARSESKARAMKRYREAMIEKLQADDAKLPPLSKGIGTAVMAQDATQTPIPTAEPGATVEPQEIIVLPASYSLGGIEFEYQGWNNCGPATITNALSIFGYTEGQTRADCERERGAEDGTT